MVIKNAAALLGVQVVNYASPLLLIPYLTHVLGAEAYGVVAYAMSLSQLATVVTDYGFGLSAPHSISRSREDKNFVNRKLGSILAGKALLLAAVTVPLISYILLNEKYSRHSGFFLLMLLPIAGQTFQPLFFFQGIEKMAFITLLTGAAKLLSLFCTVAWVKGPGDLRFIPVANGLAQILAAGIGIRLAISSGYRPVWTGWRHVRMTLSESTEYFWSRAAVATYSSAGSFFLGLVSEPVQVGYYSAAQQLYGGVKSLFSPLVQALYPHMSRRRDFTYFFRILRWSTFICAIGSLVCIGAGDLLIRLLFGPGFKAVYPSLAIAFATLAVNTPSVLLGYPFLAAFNKGYLANRSTFLGGGLQLLFLLACYLMKWTAAWQVTTSVLLVETAVLVLRVIWGREEYRKSQAAEASSLSPRRDGVGASGGSPGICSSNEIPGTM